MCVCVCVCALLSGMNVYLRDIREKQSEKGNWEQIRRRHVPGLTVRCWKSHALMMLVATFGKIPLFLLCFFSLSGSSSSPVLGEATLLSRPSPVT